MGTGKIFIVLFFLFWVIASLLLTYLSFVQIYKGFSSFSYKETDGVINSSRIISKLSSGTHGSKTVYSNELNYIYDVNGQNFSGFRICYSNVFSSDKSISKYYLDKYPEGKKVTVYYDINNYKVSVLERRVPFSSFAVLSAGLLFLFLTGGALINSLFNKKIF